METYNIAGQNISEENSKNWHDALKQLYSLEQRITTGEELAGFRLNVSCNHTIWQNGSYYEQARAYSKDEPVILIRNSPLLKLKSAEQAVKENRNGDYAHISKQLFNDYLKQAKQDAKKNPIERRAMILPSKTNFSVSLTQNSDVLQFTFGKNTEKYFNKVKEQRNISELTFYLLDQETVNKSKQPIIQQAWLHRFDSGSSLSGDGGGLGGSDGVRGVQKISGEATSQKVLLPYTIKEIEKYSRILEDIGQGKIKISELEPKAEEVLKFLQRLKTK